MSNGNSWLTYRTVVLDTSAQSFVDAHLTPGSRFDAQWQGVEWLISRSPQIGLPKDAKSPTKELLHIVAGSDIADTKEIWILYSYDEGEVVIHAATFSTE